MKIDGVDLYAAREALKRIEQACDLAVGMLVRRAAEPAIRDLCDALGIMQDAPRCPDSGTYSDLERNVQGFAAQLRELAERVRVNAVAERFIGGNHDIRNGDYFLAGGDGGVPYRVHISDHDGKWTYGNCEYHRVPRQDEHQRLYTIVEVAEIVAKIKGESR